MSNFHNVSELIVKSVYCNGLKWFSHWSIRNKLEQTCSLMKLRSSFSFSLLLPWRFLMFPLLPLNFGIILFSLLLPWWLLMYPLLPLNFGIIIFPFILPGCFFVFPLLLIWSGPCSIFHCDAEDYWKWGCCTHLSLGLLQFMCLKRCLSDHRSWAILQRKYNAHYIQFAAGHGMVAIAW